VTGAFELRTATDLFRKLEADLEDLVASPYDSRPAYNFFVKLDPAERAALDGRLRRSIT
jgi:hypothetical protein